MRAGSSPDSSVRIILELMNGVSERRRTEITIVQTTVMPKKRRTSRLYPPHESDGGENHHGGQAAGDDGKGRFVRSGGLSRADSMPMRRCMFSSTTVVTSTTMPTEEDIPIMLRPNDRNSEGLQRAESSQKAHRNGDHRHKGRPERLEEERDQGAEADSEDGSIASHSLHGTPYKVKRIRKNFDFHALRRAL